jgi:hypothetical protein
MADLTISFELNWAQDHWEVEIPPIPTQAGFDTICECAHWYEEHTESTGIHVEGGCMAPKCPCVAFVFSATETTPEMVFDRGGAPYAWPDWVKVRAVAPTLVTVLGRVAQEPR